MNIGLWRATVAREPSTVVRLMLEMAGWIMNFSSFSSANFPSSDRTSADTGGNSFSRWKTVSTLPSRCCCFNHPYRNGCTSDLWELYLNWCHSPDASECPNLMSVPTEWWLRILWIWWHECGCHRFQNPTRQGRPLSSAWQDPSMPPASLTPF